MIITIPFSGFYDSIHNDNVEHELYSGVFTDHATGCTNNDRLSELASDSIDWRELYIDYAKEYVDAFNNELGLNLVFNELSSPKEYNFTTDRIFCEISLQQAQKLWDETDGLTLKKYAAEMFTSRSGFISFYEPDFYFWGPLHTWDHNQLNCLMYAWLDDNHSEQDVFISDDKKTWNETELYLMDDFISCNGGASELIYKHCADKRLFSVSDYLNKRAERLNAA